MEKIEPASPYECWCMPCKECIYWAVEKRKCTHPEAVRWDDAFDNVSK